MIAWMCSILTRKLQVPDWDAPGVVKATFAQDHHEKCLLDQFNEELEAFYGLGGDSRDFGRRKSKRVQ